MNKTILRQIIELENKTVSEMREIHDNIMPKPAPASVNKEYLRPRIAYRLQELELGSLKEENKDRLLKIAGGTPTNSLKRHSDFIDGTKICREWNGVMHEVEVVKGCFIYQGQKFKGLSPIATKITGTKWSGNKFFKLRTE